uniref:Secreted protein n=1 Tax=Romanomermis culicivorax TaxID=13658 RepID=A0A915IWJ4_ROMCU
MVRALCLFRCLWHCVVLSLGILPHSAHGLLGGGVCFDRGSSMAQALWALQYSTSSCC